MQETFIEEESFYDEELIESDSDLLVFNTEGSNVNNYKKLKLWYVFLLVIPLFLFLGIILIMKQKK
jgi:hypothetical protein